MESASQATRLTLELFHIQTNTSFKLPQNLSVIHIGKPNDQIPPDIDVSGLPDADVVSRIHAEIRVQGSNFFIEDLGSSNGTYINNTKLEPSVRYNLILGDKITLGQAGKVTFIFQSQQPSVAPNSNFPTNPQSNPSSNPAATVVETQVVFATKLIGLVLMFVGLGFLSSSLIIGSVGFIYNTPLIVLGIAGILTLTYGGSNRRFGWVFIGIGVAIAIGSGGIAIVPITVFSFLLASGAFSVGYQLFTTGKIWDFNSLSLMEVFKR